MKRKSETELKKIAKSLYFGKGSKRKLIYADEIGRFSDKKGNLLSINKGKDIKVVRILKEDVAKTSTEGVINFSENPELFPGAQLKAKGDDKKEIEEKVKELEKIYKKELKASQEALNDKQKELDIEKSQDKRGYKAKQKELENQLKESQDALNNKQKQLEDALKPKE